ncbi:hypothetical protein PCYB_061390 [Plasmodium cynomolgi strain B]|uniref:PH domain-containing protein n=1 Tax=Plasmodium cynomolgi (strain B) TaxID=1120755 RepID=K6V8D1_PLACD|nr:hypothetical protein PCYB_061390 [Plasmodium cynomolgi strain B]GAB65407.1 hypothetical protein PCYB_061390 [Plasmodium cynomolgi strain B]
MNEAKKRTDHHHPQEKDLKFDGPCDNKENSSDGNFANISNIATINFANLEKEFQKIYRYPSQERPPSRSQSSESNEWNEANKASKTNKANESNMTNESNEGVYFCRKAQEKRAHAMVNQPSEETIHTQRDGRHAESSIGRAISKGEGKRRADYYGGTLPGQLRRSEATGRSRQENFHSTNSIEQILKSIQEDTILGTHRGDDGNSGGGSSNVGAGLADAADPVKAINEKKTIHPMCRLWWDDKPFAYHWDRGMNRQEVQRCVHNFCINIASEDFYLARLERLNEDNQYKEKQKNIQKIPLKGNTYAYYKICERYEYESLGDVKPNQEYIIKRKNHVKEKLMYPLNFPEVLRAIEYTKEGGNLLKHTVYSIPHLRFFFISKDLNFIKWFSSRKTDEQCKIYFQKINSLEIKIVHEDMLENLKVDILKRLSFSIVYMNEKKKITLTCKSLQEFNYWVTSIRALMFHSKRMKTTRSVLLSHRRTTRNGTPITGKPNPTRNTNLKKNSTKKELNTEEGKSSLKLFHLYKLIVFPHYNLYQIKTKFYLLKEKAYKYRVLIEKEVDEYEMDIYLGGGSSGQSGHHEGGDNDRLSNESDPLEEECTTDPESASTLCRNSPPLYHCNASGNVGGNEAGKENPVRRRPLSDGKRNGTWSGSSSPHVALPEVYTLNKETNLSVRDDGKVAKRVTHGLAVGGGGEGGGEEEGGVNPVGGNHENEAEEDTDQFKLQLIVKIYNRIDRKLKQVQKDIMQVVKLLKREESEKQPNPQGGSSGFSLDQFWKYTTDAYRTLESKFYKTGGAHYHGDGHYGGDGRYHGDNRYPGYDRYPHPNELHTQQRRPELRRTELRKPELHKREEQPGSLPPNEWDTPNEKDPPEGHKNQSRKLIHSILFDMWLCEMELGNIDDIYTTYVCNSKRKKNFITNMDAPAFVKNISQQISNTILRYMNM